MESSEEITDDILSFLLDNARESDSSFVNEKSGNFSDVSFLSDTNPLLEPASPSLKSVFSSKKLEWDSSADVGCLVGIRPGFQLSSIEKMALSNSASKLCYDEDDHSRALIAKIDFLLGRSKREERNYPLVLSVLPSIESSNGSLDTVVPSRRCQEQKENQKQKSESEVQGTQNKISSSSAKPSTNNVMCISPNDFQLGPNLLKTVSSSRSSLFPLQNRECERKMQGTQKKIFSSSAKPSTSNMMCISPNDFHLGSDLLKAVSSSRSSPIPFQNWESEEEVQGARIKIPCSSAKPSTSNMMYTSQNDVHLGSNSQKTISSSRSSPFPTQRSLTKWDEIKSASAAEAESDPSVINSCIGKTTSKSKSIKQNVIADEQALRGCQEKSASSTERSKYQCESHQSLGSREKIKRQKQVMQELQVYKGLKEHLQNLKQYVTQLEKTWKFLDETQSRTGSSSSGRRSKSENRQKRTIERNITDCLTSSSSVISTSAISVVSKSERSFDIEPLNFQNSDNESQKCSKPKQSKLKCCSHCSLGLKTFQSTYRTKTVELKTQEMSVQVEEAPISFVEPIIEAQREPIAFDISVRSKTDKISLQEALKTKRPDFFAESEMRRKMIQDMVHMRLVDKVDANSIPRIFTYQQSRKNTEKVYRQLPEAKNRNHRSNHKEMICTNKLRAAAFEKVMILTSVLLSLYNIFPTITSIK